VRRWTAAGCIIDAAGAEARTVAAVNALAGLRVSDVMTHMSYLRDTRAVPPTQMARRLHW
jgi:hypothetical protein